MKKFCIYTNQLTDTPSIEHIIPLSLGGHNDFCISVDKDFNNSVGSKVDGKLANDFLVLFDREKHNTRGYSCKKPAPVVKNASLIDGSPAHVRFLSTGLEIFDLKSKSILSKTDSRGKKVTLNKVSIDMDIGLMFTAKVALGAGYFAYGDIFNNHVATNEFRNIMNLDKKNLPKDSKAKVFDRFRDNENGDEIFIILKMMTEMYGCSAVIMAPSANSFGVAVSVLGRFMGFINVPSESSFLPNSGSFRMGHCIYLLNNKVKRLSFDYVRLKLIEHLDQNNANSANAKSRADN